MRLWGIDIPFGPRVWVPKVALMSLGLLYVLIARGNMSAMLEMVSETVVCLFGQRCDGEAGRVALPIGPGP